MKNYEVKNFKLQKIFITVAGECESAVAPYDHSDD